MKTENERSGGVLKKKKASRFYIRPRTCQFKSGKHNFEKLFIPEHVMQIKPGARKVTDGHFKR